MIDANFTREWWKRVCADPDKMRAWLVKLQQTEIDGFYDWKYYQTQFAAEMSKTPNAFAITTNIGADEYKHSEILTKLMGERNIAVVKGYGNQSSYWNEVNAHITELADCCAVNYYGEALAAFRFEIIADMPETPSDLKEALRIILPDEQFHRETLKRLAGEEALAKIKPVHEAAMARLLKA